MSLAAVIQEKLDNDDDLTEEEVAWAADHAMPLPEEYGDAVRSHQEETVAGRPLTPIVDGGSMAGSGPGLFLTEDELGTLTKDQLVMLGEATGKDVSGTKAEMVALLSGGMASGALDDEDEED